MKIVMVSKALVVGAYQRKLEEMCKQPGVHLTAIVPPAWREGSRTMPLERAHTAGYDLLVAPLALNGQFHLHFYPTLGRLLRQLQPDIVHLDEEPYNLATWHGLRLAAATGARSLFFTWQNLIRRYPWPFRHFELANYRRARFALAGNPTAVEVLRAKGYRGPVRVIPQFGVDPDIFSPSSQPRAENVFTIGYAGRLVPEKGVDVLMHACAAMNGHNWQLLLRGEGPVEAELTALSEHLGITDRVRFMGKIPSTQMADFYRSLDVFVLPSVTRPNWAEQFARVLIEAMACGIPILGSSSGEIPHVLGDGGLIFPEGDEAGLAGLLVRLARDTSERREIGARGRARVLAQFTQAQIAVETVEVYRDMLSA